MALNYKFLIGAGNTGSYTDRRAYDAAPIGPAFYEALARDPFTSKSGAIDEIRSMETLMNVLDNPRGYLADYTKARKDAYADASREAQEAYENLLRRGISKPLERANKVYDNLVKSKLELIDLQYDSKFIKKARESVQFGIKSKY